MASYLSNIESEILFSTLSGALLEKKRMEKLMMSHCEFTDSHERVGVKIARKVHHSGLPKI